MRHLRITIGNKSYDVTVEDVTETDIPSGPPSSPPTSLSTTGAAPPEPGPASRASQPKSTAAGEPGAIASPMAGAIKTVHVKPGDQVTASQALIVLEAMKMDNQITAPVAGTVKSVDVAVGDSVQEGDVLLRLE